MVVEGAADHLGKLGGVVQHRRSAVNCNQSLSTRDKIEYRLLQRVCFRLPLLCRHAAILWIALQFIEEQISPRSDRAIIVEHEHVVCGQALGRQGLDVHCPRGVERAGLLAEDFENAVDIRNNVMLETGEQREHEHLPLGRIDRSFCGGKPFDLCRPLRRERFDWRLCVGDFLGTAVDSQPCNQQEGTSSEVSMLGMVWFFRGIER